MAEQVHTPSNEKRRVKLPIRAYLLYLLLASFLLTGVTFSKYITVSQGGDAARVITMGDILLTESGDFYDDLNEKLMIVPGVDLAKKALLAYEGSEAACYLFIEVTAAQWETEDHYIYSAAEGKIVWSVDDFWTYLESEGNQHIYYRVLAPNVEIQDQDIIKEGKVVVSDLLTKTELGALSGLSLTLRATAVQLDGFGDYPTEAEHAQAAWSSVKSK